MEQKILSAAASKLIRRLKFGFTRYGGARREMLKTNDKEWVCQVCATTHSSDVPCFMVELFIDEYVKICSKCQHIKEVEHIPSVFILIRRVRLLTPLEVADLT